MDFREEKKDMNKEMQKMLKAINDKKNEVKTRQSESCKG